MGDSTISHLLRCQGQEDQGHQQQERRFEVCSECRMRQPCHRHDWRLRCIRGRLPEDAGRRSCDFEGRGIHQKFCYRNSRPHSPRSKPEPKDAWKLECAPVLDRGLADTLAGLIHKQIEASLFTRWFVISKFRYPTIPPTFFGKKFSIKVVRGATPWRVKIRLVVCYGFPFCLWGNSSISFFEGEHGQHLCPVQAEDHGRSRPVLHPWHLLVWGHHRQRETHELW